MRQWSDHHWFRSRLVAWPVPSHYLNQWRNIVNWSLGNKLQLNLKRNLYIFVQENAFENVVCDMAAILSQPQCVNPLELRPEYSKSTRSIPWLLMPWLHMSPGHQQPWNSLCGINRSLSSMRKHFNFWHHCGGEKWEKYFLLCFGILKINQNIH